MEDEEIVEEEVIVVDEATLVKMLLEGEAWCERCRCDAAAALDIYKLWWKPKQYEVHILCAPCSVFLPEWIRRLRGMT